MALTVVAIAGMTVTSLKTECSMTFKIPFLTTNRGCSSSHVPTDILLLFLSSPSSPSPRSFPGSNRTPFTSTSGRDREAAADFKDPWLSSWPRPGAGARPWLVRLWILPPPLDPVLLPDPFPRCGDTLFLSAGSEPRLPLESGMTV